MGEGIQQSSLKRTREVGGQLYEQDSKEAKNRECLKKKEWTIMSMLLRVEYNMTRKVTYVWQYENRQYHAK